MDTIKYFNRLLLTGIIAICSVLPVRGATVLFSDNFDSEHGGIASFETVDYRAFANFDVSGNGVDLLGVGFFDLWPGNGLYVDIAHNMGGRIETKPMFALQSGVSYTLTFALAGNGLINAGIPGYETNDSVTVQLGSYIETFTRAYNTPFLTVTRTFTAAESENARLIFDAVADPDGAGVKLDAITLTQLDAAAPVPEPASVLLCGGGLVVAPLIRRWKNNTQRSKLI